MRQSNFKHILLFLVLLLSTAFTMNVNADITKRADVKKFIDKMVKKHDFKRSELVDLFQHVVLKKKIIDAITRPAEAKPWYKYRKIFITDKRIDGGVKFWSENASTLKRAHEVYGVPEEIVVAIIGVETLYGKHKGRYRTLDSLSTLGFDYPKRGKFFRSELKHFLLMSREEGLDPLSVKGSYAGAMGKPQFIASSFRSYAVDFNDDGKRDLWHSTIDTIGSVANYFKRHKWRKDKPITSLANVNGAKQTPSLVKKGIRPHIKVSKLKQYGITMEKDLPGDDKAALIELETKNGNEHWIGLDNFYVITRYNHSQLYAMAVYQLSQAILKKRQAMLAKSQK